jgi:hypothetical protein
LTSICFFEQLLDVFGSCRLTQKSAKLVIPELAGDVFQRPQVIARTVWGRNQKEEERCLLPVQRLEIESFCTDAYGSDQFFDTRMLGMRDGYAATDAGAA